MAEDQFTRLLSFIRRLDGAAIQHALSSVRGDSICVEVTVPGERWEVEFTSAGGIEVERFRSSGEISDDSALDVLFADFAD